MRKVSNLVYRAFDLSLVIIRNGRKRIGVGAETRSRSLGTVLRIFAARSNVVRKGRETKRRRPLLQTSPLRRSKRKGRAVNLRKRSTYSKRKRDSHPPSHRLKGKMTEYKIIISL